MELQCSDPEKNGEMKVLKDSIKTKQQVSESFSIYGVNSGVTQVSRHASDLTRSIGGSCCFMACPAAEQDPLMH